MSSQWEHTIANGIDGRTDRSVKAYRCGYSGNSKHAQPDVLVVDADTATAHALELKGPIRQNRCYIDAEDCGQLVECTNSMTVGYLVVKFQRRRPIVVRYFDSVPQIDGYDEMTAAERLAAVAPVSAEPRTTDSGNLVIDKPSLDDWPSATEAAADELVILSDMGVVNENSIDADGSLLADSQPSYVQ